MPKILSQAGVSLADVYDIVGSVAGVETLESRNISLVHEMGATIFSERLNGVVRRAGQTGILQSVAFDVAINDLPTTPTRIHAVCAFANITSRLSLVQVSMRQRDNAREIPILIWDSAIDDEVSVRLQDDGGAVATVFMLRPTGGFYQLGPNLIGGENLQVVRNLVMRGQTSAFGAGTVDITFLTYISFSALEGVSSHGLPLPSW